MMIVIRYATLFLNPDHNPFFACMRLPIYNARPVPYLPFTWKVEFRPIIRFISLFALAVLLTLLPFSPLLIEIPPRLGWASGDRAL